MSKMTEESGVVYRYVRISRRALKVSKHIYSKTTAMGIHFHNAYEILLIEQGEYKVYCPELVYEGTGPCIIMFKLGSYHGISRSNCETVPYVFHAANFLQSLIDEISEHPLCAEGYLDRGSFIIPIDQETASRFLPLMERLEALSDNYTHDAPMPPLMPGYFMTVLGYIYELIKEGRSIDINSESDDENYISDVIREVSDAVNRGKNVSVSSLAETFHVGNTKLSKDFKKITKMSVKEMIDTLRLERTKKLLCDGLSSHDVAERCGFSSTNYFIQFFNKHMNMSPGAYRKMKKQPPAN